MPTERYIWVVAAVITGMAVTGCGKSGEAALVGKWVAERPVLIQTVEFTKDGRMNMSGMSGHFSTWYKVEGGEMTTGRLNGPVDDKGSWRIEGDLLKLGHPLASGTYRRAQ